MDRGKKKDAVKKVIAGNYYGNSRRLTIVSFDDALEPDVLIRVTN